MSRRKIRNTRKDKRIFKSTSEKTQQVNIKPVTMRGGIRL